MHKSVTLARVLELAKHLPLRDKIRLIEQIASQIERELMNARPKLRKSLCGLWRGIDITKKTLPRLVRKFGGRFAPSSVPANFRPREAALMSWTA